MNHLEDALKHIEGLDAFPRVAVRVLELTSNDANPRELVAVIEQDPGLTVQVLRLANSALSGSRIMIESLAEATARLGLRPVANLALTSGCSTVFTGYGASSLRSNECLWTESLHNALHARQLAKRDGRVDPELAYTVGLLQNIGHLVLDRFMPDELEAIRGERAEGKTLLVAERAVLGIDHAQCGALMVRRWGLPRSIIRGIQFHHDPAKVTEQEVLCAICGKAEELAGRCLAQDSDSLIYHSSGAQYGIVSPDSGELGRIDSEIRELVAISRG